MPNYGSLHVVAIPIGDKNDITLRALEILKSVNLIVAEEIKTVRKIFHDYNFKSEFFLLNEHNEAKDANFVVDFLLKGENIALISDCGTPAFADPGTILIDLCHRKNIRVIPVPGASSLMSALSVSGFNIKKFHFAGFINQQKEARQAEWEFLKKKNETIVIMETPYRIDVFFEELTKYFPEREICFCYKATMPEEIIQRGKAAAIKKMIKEKELKGEFVIVINASQTVQNFIPNQTRKAVKFSK